MRGALVLLAGLLAGCAPSTRDLPAVAPFDRDRYLGRWYELARYDHGFERGLSHVRADYALRPDGRIAVVNAGWDRARGRWRSATGVAVAPVPGVGELSVTFFWPFSGAYRIVDLDRPGGRWAIVTGPTRAWLWILHRDPVPPPGERARLIARCAELGFDPGRMILVPQDDPPPESPLSGARSAP